LLRGDIFSPLCFIYNIYMPIFNVPFLSQYSDLGDHEWRARGCGITALKMVMDFWHAQNSQYQTVGLDDLLRRGIASGAYLEGIGWRHRGLVELAQNFGYGGFNVDYAPQSPNPKSATEAWAMACKELAHGPVMVSVFSRLDPTRGGGHIVVVAGVENDLVAFNDPEELVEREGRRLIAVEKFLPAFKRRYIVIRPAATAESGRLTEE
jgi:hypothetical protein